MMMALATVIRTCGVTMALYTDRAHWAAHTPVARRRRGWGQRVTSAGAKRSQILELVVRVAGSLSLDVPPILRLLGRSVLTVIDVELRLVRMRDPFVDVLDPQGHVLITAAEAQTDLVESDASGSHDARRLSCGTERVLPPARWWPA